MGAVELARDGLCRMIASGELQPGQVLPSEVELCERLGVSRSSLREAQRILGVAGALTSRPGTRSFVSEMNADQILSGLDMVIPLLPLERYLELFTMREVLEGHAAALASARMTESEVTELRSVAQQLADTSDADRSQALDRRFHSLIFDGSRDTMIAALLETLRRRGQDYRILELGQGRGQEMKRISDQAHLEIALAIHGRDPEAARFLTMQHVRCTKRWLEGFWPEPTVL